MVQAIGAGQFDMVILGDRATNKHMNDCRHWSSLNDFGAVHKPTWDHLPGPYAVIAGAYFEGYASTRTDLVHFAVKTTPTRPRTRTLIDVVTVLIASVAMAGTGSTSDLLALQDFLSIC